jgi:hypothetical protein
MSLLAEMEHRLLEYSLTGVMIFLESCIQEWLIFVMRSVQTVENILSFANIFPHILSFF